GAADSGFVNDKLGLAERLAREQGRDVLHDGRVGRSERQTFQVRHLERLVDVLPREGIAVCAVRLLDHLPRVLDWLNLVVDNRNGGRINRLPQVHTDHVSVNRVRGNTHPHFAFVFKVAYRHSGLTSVVKHLSTSIEGNAEPSASMNSHSNSC